MRHTLLLAVLTLAVPSVSHAQLQLGGRLGYAAAMGNALEHARTGEKIGMKDYSLKSQVPLQLDVGFKVSPEISLGGYLGYGFGQVDDAYLQKAFGRQICGADAGDGKIACTGSAWRIGVQGFYTFATANAPLVPWIGLSLGRESATAEAKDSTGGVTVKLTGYELGLQLGGDYRVADGFVFGPYVGLSFGKFSDAEITVTGSSSTSQSIDKTAWHQWLGFGLRGMFTL
jgi:hypothetical protein